MVTQKDVQKAKRESAKSGAVPDDGSRTDEAKLLQVPISIVLAGKDYEVPVPSYAVNRQWRLAFCEHSKKMAAVSKIDGEDPDSIVKHADAVIMDQIDGVIDLLFLASPELQEIREEIEDTATEEELLDAAQAVMEVLSPLGIARKKAGKKTGGKHKSGGRR